MKKIISYGRQQILEEDIQKVVDILRSDFLTQGPEVAKFEFSFAKYVGSNYAVAVSSGTAALHLSVLSLNIQPGDKVITSPITFAATANCVRYCGGEVVFSDINRETYLLDIDKVRTLLENSPKGTYKGIIPVDFGGRAVNLEAFRELADEFDLWIIEDACHAPGGYFYDSTQDLQTCGNGTFADLSIFSFHPVKHITSGEGGMITTNSRILYEKLVQLRTHGIVKNPQQFKNSIEIAGGKDKYPGWYMEMQDLGFNYRITDFQAALGLSQLQRAEDGLIRRKTIAETYFKSFKSSNFIKHQNDVLEGHAYHLYVLEVENRLGLYDFLKVNNIQCQIHYIPCHLMPYYISLGYKVGDFPNSESYYKQCITLPLYPSLTVEEQDYIIDKVKEFYL